ncbi:MAG: PhoPQ-activated pathogenicity-related family protein [Verrucomicrobiales bacterium]|nr:PhoPQ-activated pathogenicity-related family protein [Verrucomicrobiales bacterium]
MIALTSFGRGRFPLASTLLTTLVLVANGFAHAAEPLSPTAREATRKAPLTALDRYVHTPDPAYSWKMAGSVKGEGGTAYYLDMVSQTWLTTNEVNRPEWRHWVVIAKPDQLEHSTALLFIAGGGNKDQKPPRVNGDLVRIARETKSVVVELKMVPNQPVIFGGDGEERVEDNLIGYTWDKFLRTGDEKWPARLPMTKAAVRAMDTVTAFCASEAGGGVKVDQFVVAGGSKRGWTTWTTAIVDRRVVGICPIVIDVLNVEASMMHHYQAYGFWAPAVGDYVRHGTMDRMQTPAMHALMKIEDPYSYVDRLKIPKLMLNATGDQFFLPDSSQFYFDTLHDPKYLRYVPNADHSLKGSDAYETLLAWHQTLIAGKPLPKFDWKHRRDGTVRVRTPERPVAVKLWQATNPKARDFRIESLGPVWTSQPVAGTDQGVYESRVSAPAAGWTAYFMELTFDVGAATPLKLTTDVRVTPDTLPHPAPQPRRVP